MQRLLITLLAVALAVGARPARAEPTRPVRIGLALSGGAALGIAHIGVLKVLEREGIDVVAISGNSMGSMVGGLSAAGLPATAIESITVNANWDVLFSASVPFGARYLAERRQEERYAVRLRHRNLLPALPSGIVPLQNVDFLLMDLLAGIEHDAGYDFDSLPVPYRAVAVDLVSGRLVVMREGRLARAIRASIAIPGVFSPVKLDSMELVDGGVQRYLPVEPLLEFEPDLIVAVLTMKRGERRGFTLVDIVSRSMDLAGVGDLTRQQELADIVIEPDVGPFAHSDFARAEELIAAGERAAEAALPELRALIRGREVARYRRAVPRRPAPRVGSVEFEGLSVTRPATLRPLVRTEPGQFLDFGRLRRDLTRVFNTGLFDDVNYRLDFAGRDSVDIIIELQERAYGFYLLGMRYDNADRVGFGVEAGQGNLWGTGASVRAALQLGVPTEFRAGISGTRLLAVPLAFRLEGAWRTRRRYHYYRTAGHAGTYRFEYDEATREAGVELGYGLGRSAFFTFGFDWGLVRYEGLPPPLAGLPEQDLLVGPSARFEFNNSDDLYLPRSGSAFRLEARSSLPLLESARRHLRAELNWDRVFRLGPRFLFRQGWVAGVALGDSVRAEYFRAGGANLPGFAHEQFSSRYRLSFEPAFDIVIMELLGRPDYPVYLRMFGAAATFRRPDRLFTDELSLPADLHWSAGLGLVGNTPLGPVKVLAGLADFGKPRSEEYAPMALRVWLEVGRDFRYVR